jgi:copper(I)-binding protein
LILSMAVTIAVLAACQPVPPAEPEIQIDDAWARPSRPMTAPGQRADSAAAAVTTSAVYFTLRNAGGRSDTLRAASTDVANAIEIHESRVDDGVMRMRQLQSVEVPAGESVTFRPGGLHVMLIGLTRDLAVGDAFTLTLDLSQSGERSIRVTVRQDG